MASRLVLITGATRGLGRALADEFIARGHRVIGCGRSGAKIDELNRVHGPENRFDVLDVSDDGAVAGWAASVLKQFGPPDLLLNGAAMINRNASLWQVPVAEFDALIDVNIKGVANTIRHFVPAMIERRAGVIVNFSSDWGRGTDPKVAPYCASKWAIEGLSKALALELPATMAAIPLSPGIIDTDMLRTCFGCEAGRFPRPEAWAKTAVPYLLAIGPEDSGRSLTVGDR